MLANFRAKEPDGKGIRLSSVFSTGVLKLTGVFFFTILFLVSCDKKVEPKESKKERAIKVKTLELKSVKWTKRFSVKGYTEAVHSLEVKPEVSGRVTGVFKGEGERVKAGEPLAKIDGRDFEIRLEELKHRRNSLLYRLTALEKSYERRDRLYKRELISREEFEKIESDYRSLKEDLKSVEAQISATQRELAKTLIVSPFEGYILKKSVEVGDVVSPQSRLFTLVKLSPLWFTFRVPYDRLGYVSKGTEVSLSLPDLELKGKVDHVLPSADRDRLFTVRLLLENRDLSLKPLTYGIVHIPEGEVVAFKVPEQTVQVSQKRSFVWKVENSRAKSMDVEVLGHEGDQVVISGNLKEGDKVVVEGFMFLYEGAKVIEE